MVIAPPGVRTAAGSAAAPGDVTQLLSSLGLSQYLNLFREEAIDNLSLLVQSHLTSENSGKI